MNCPENIKGQKVVRGQSNRYDLSKIHLYLPGGGYPKEHILQGGSYGGIRRDGKKGEGNSRVVKSVRYFCAGCCGDVGREVGRARRGAGVLMVKIRAICHLLSERDTFSTSYL